MTGRVVTIGRIGVDLYGQEPGAGLEDPQSFAKAVGGSPTNVAVGVARYGHHAAVLTAVGDDALGRFARAALDRHGVDTQLVLIRPGRTPVVLAGLRVADAPEFVFYRDDPAPDTCIRLDDLSTAQRQVIQQADLLWLSASALAREPLAGTVGTLLGERLAPGEGKPARTLLDLDYRPSFWPDAAAAHRALQAILPRCDLVVGNLEECTVATGLPAGSAPAVLAEALHARGPRQVLVKAGSQGVLVSERGPSSTAAPPGARLPSASMSPGQTAGVQPAIEACLVPGIPVTVRCGLGAGDAFGAAVVHGLLAGWPLPQIARFANAAGAIVASRLLCSDAMPTASEVDQLLEAQP